MPAASVVRYEPGSATSSLRPAYCQARAKIRARSRRSCSSSVYHENGSVLALGHSRFASMMRWRNCCVRGSRGELKISPRRALLEDAALVEEADLVGDVAGEGHLVGGDHHRHAARRELADHREHLRRRAPGRARSSPRRRASAPAASRARARSRRAAAGRPRAGRDTRRSSRRARSARAARSRARRPPASTGRARRAARASRCAARSCAGRG